MTDHEASATVYCGDAGFVLPGIADGSVSVIITDPPYGLADITTAKTTETLSAWLAGDRSFIPGGAGFMGRAWDRFVPPPAIWDECSRVLPPGGHMMVFASSRTADLMSMSIRLAGFEIRDTIAWIHSQGMPKGTRANRMAGPQWVGWNTTLKPGLEPIIVARKPLSGTLGTNLKRHGVGAMNIDATRTDSAAGTGRWPANVVLSHAPGCTEELCLPGCSVDELDVVAGIRTSGANPLRRHAELFPHLYGTFISTQAPIVHRGADAGLASRFYPVFRYAPKAKKSERPVVDGSQHVSVKPLDLMRWLVRLATPPGGLVLDPFAGSGTTLQAAMLEGFDSIGIEAEENHCALIRKRLSGLATDTSPVDL